MTGIRKIAAAGLAAIACLALVSTTSTTTATAATAATATAPEAATTRPAPKAASASVKRATAKAPAKVAAGTDFSSIFAGQPGDLVNSGWGTCATPISWSVDTAGLSAADAAAQIANIDWALGQWSQVSGLTFQYAGTEQLTYNEAAFTLTPAGGVQQRHIYLAFVPAAQSSRLNADTVGMASPSQVWPTTKEITTGTAVFSSDYVATSSAKADRALYLHELGHVLGLAHAQSSANIMYPVVTTGTTLGSGDVAGVRSMTKPCTA